MIANLNATSLTRSKAVLTGFNKSMFVSDVSDLSCGICLDVYNNPYQCKTGHMYCKSCFVSFLKSSTGDRCPTCRVEIGVHDLSANLYVKNVIDDLIVTCKCLEDDDTKHMGCDWTGKLSERSSRQCPVLFGDCDSPGCKVVGYHLTRLKAHKKKCMYRISECVLCGKNMPHSDIKQHKRICESRIVICSDCGIEMTNRDLCVHHGEYLCEMIPFRCPFDSLFGMCVPSCTGSVNRVTELSHLGEHEMLINTIFDKYLELMNTKDILSNCV
jgi:hypothetical protein